MSLIYSQAAVDIAHQFPSLHQDERRELALLIDKAIGSVVGRAVEIVRGAGHPGLAGEIVKIHPHRHES